MLSQKKVFDDELSLLPGMIDTGRLGFALQLKFRQVQGHYPDSVRDFPSGIVHTIVYAKVCATKKSGSLALIVIVIRQKISRTILPLTAHILIPCCRHPLMRQPLLIRLKAGCVSGSVR